MNHRLRLALLAAIPLLAASIRAEAADRECAIPDHNASQRPGDGGEPTDVTIGVRMSDLTDIDDVDQTLTAEFFVLQRWTDQRLTELVGCEVPLSAVWSPNIGFVNSGRMFPNLPQIVEVDENGTVTYLQTLFGSLASYEKLEDFPFDEHVFEVWLTSASYPENEVRLRDNEQFTGRRDLLNISDWRIGDVTASVRSEIMHATDAEHSVFELQIPASRIQEFYIWKIFLPIALIVMMSWVVFWVDPVRFGPQIGLSATSMLTLIAFLFATTNIVPRLGYFTRFDVFLGLSLIIVFLAFLQSLITAFLVGREALTLARRIDVVSRVLFPAAFLLIILVVLIL